MLTQSITTTRLLRALTMSAVSYTHLDVYKRQLKGTAPALSSANKSGGYYGVQIIATDNAGNETTCLLYTSRCV